MVVRVARGAWRAIGFHEASKRRGAGLVTRGLDTRGRPHMVLVEGTAEALDGLQRTLRAAADPVCVREADSLERQVAAQRVTP